MSHLWYKTAVIYAIDVARFQDGDGDGLGDLAGLISRLDYLVELGVDCVWLLPFFPSPRRDNGYDVTDYMGVDPRLGTLEEFAEFVHRAGECGIRVIVDLVMDHTSDEHPWFKAARKDAASRYRKYYVFRDFPAEVPPGHGAVFPGEMNSVWTWDETAQAYYFHRFYDFQPSLDLGNPEVVREVHKVLDFWSSFGVSAFRLDAVPIMVGLDEPPIGAPRDPHELLRGFSRTVSKHGHGMALLGEADVQPESLMKYFGDEDGDKLSMLFNFLLNNYMFLALAKHDREPLVRALQQLPAAPRSGQWVNFLRNLDELNLGWLCSEDRDAAFAAFASDPDELIYGRGVRKRLAPMLSGDGDGDLLRLAFSLMFAMPGTPMFVFGDELGMGEDLARPGRDAARVPMHWSAEKNAGFSTAPPERLVQPVISEGPYGFGRLNAESQAADPDSMLNFVRRLVRLRRETPEVGMGSWHMFETGEDSIFAMRSIWRGGTVVTVHNLAAEPRSVTLDLKDQRGRRLSGLLGTEEEHVIIEGMVTLEIPAYGVRWYRVEGERGE